MSFQARKYRLIAPKDLQQTLNSNMPFITKPNTSNLQITALPNTQMAIPGVSNLQMTPYFINDNFIDNFDSSQYIMVHDNIFQ